MTAPRAPGLPASRLAAAGASLALHLAAIAALANLPGGQSAQPPRRAPGLTLVVLEPERPSAAPEPLASPQPRRAALPRAAPAVATAQLPGTAAAPQAPAVPPAAPAQPMPAPAPRAEPVETPPAKAPAGDAISAYQALVWQKIHANRPRAATMPGTAVVLFRLGTNGQLLSATLSRSSGNVLLDKIALRTVRQSAPFPPPPADLAEARLVFEIPVNFR